MGGEIRMPAAFVALQKHHVTKIPEQQRPIEGSESGTGKGDQLLAKAKYTENRSRSRERDTFIFDDEEHSTIDDDGSTVHASEPQDPEDVSDRVDEQTAHSSTHVVLPETGEAQNSQKSQNSLVSSPRGPDAASLNSAAPVVKSHTTSTSSFQCGVDRYGFKKHSHHVSEEDYNTWANKYKHYCARRKQKWTRLLKENGLVVPPNKAPVRFPPMSQKLKRYVRKGIPAEWRGNAWWWYCHGQDKLNAHGGLYDKLVKESQGLNNSDTEHIERDLHRTFPDNVNFQNDPITGEESVLLASLRRVLVAFSVYQPKVGYCQSLNFIVGNLLLFVDEERAFWMLVIITQSYLTGLHEVNLEQVNISQGILMISVRDRLPKIWNALGLEQMYEENFISNLPPISLCTASWFMSMMVNVLPTETMMRVWDCFFVEGNNVMYRIALTLFKLIEPTLSRNPDDIEVFQAIQNVPRGIIDPSTLMGACFKRANGFGHLSSDDIELLREFVQERRRAAQKDIQTGRAPSTTDRDEYAKFHPGRRLRAKLSLYR